MWFIFGKGCLDNQPFIIFFGFRLFLIHNESGGEQSALLTLLLAQLLPQMVGGREGNGQFSHPAKASESDLNEMLDDLMMTAKQQMKKRRSDEE